MQSPICLARNTRIVGDNNDCNFFLPVKFLKQFSEFFSYDVVRILSSESSVISKDVVGGTSPNQVKEAIKNARKNLLHDKA